MARNLIAFGAGLTFALGLSISGMTQPAKIVGFLDVAGTWDPTLVFVMAGAVGTYALLYRWIRRQRKPALAPRFGIPPVKDLDRRLLGGAAVFGVGWGIGGFCPGPALVALVSLHPAPWIVVGGMVAGMVLFECSPLARAGGQRPGNAPSGAATPLGGTTATDA